METLKINKTCPYISTFQGLNLQGEEKKRKAIEKLFIEVKDNDFSKLGDKSYLFRLFQTRINKNLYSLKHEFNNDAKKFVNECYRFYAFFSNQYTLISTKTERLKIRISDDYQATVRVDLIAKRLIDNKVTLIRVKSGKSDFTLKPNTKNYYMEDLEMYGLHLALMENADYQYSGAGEVMMYFLQRKDEKSTLSDLDESKPAESNKNYFTGEFTALDLENAANKTREYIDSYLYNLQKSSDITKCRNCTYVGLCNHVHEDYDLLQKVKVEEVVSDVSEYNTQQQKVVCYSGGVARVIAGAGTGKTTVLTGNVIFNITAGNISQHDILLTTFTEAGAIEIKAKLLSNVKKQGLDVSDFQNIEVVNFNSLGYKIIQENYQTLGYTDTPMLIDEDFKCKILENLIDKYPMMPNFNYSNPYLQMFRASGVVREISDIFAEHKENITGKSELPANLIDMFKEFETYLLESNLIEFSDQIHLCLNLLKNHPHIAKKYAKRHIIVDEFQDTSKEQLEIIKILYENAQDPKTLIVVGDDSQAIFGFRNVGPENLICLQDTFPNVVDFNVLENYRSYSEIIDVANTLVGEMKEKVVKKGLTSIKGSGGKVVDYSQQDYNQTLEKYVQEITQLVNLTGKPEDVAYIAPTRLDLLFMYRRLKENNIPATIVVSEYLRDNSKVNAVCNLAKYLLNYSNTIALATWLQESQSDFDYKKDVTTVLLDQAALIQSALTPLNDADKITWFLTQINSLHSDMGLDTLNELIKKRSFDKFNDLLNYIADIVRKNSLVMIENKGLKYKAVTLSTVHAAKGKEWETVFLNAAGCKGETEEEAKRLQYVGVTRAKKNLHFLPLGNK